MRDGISLIGVIRLIGKPFAACWFDVLCVAETKGWAIVAVYSLADQFNSSI
jgi:hypothetical protein